jgi:hypothetical protein
VASLRRWRDAGSCFAPPVLVAGDALGTNIGYELLVGYTRLRNLLGLLDWEKIPDVQKRLVCVRLVVNSRSLARIPATLVLNTLY